MRRLCSNVEAFMAVSLFFFFFDGIVCGWQGYGKCAAPVVQVQRRCHTVGAVESQYRILPCRDRAWRPCQVIKENKLIREVFCLALGFDLQCRTWRRSRAIMVRATDPSYEKNLELCKNSELESIKGLFGITRMMIEGNSENKNVFSADVASSLWGKQNA